MQYAVDSEDKKSNNRNTNICTYVHAERVVYMKYRYMSIEDYEKVYSLWMTIDGFVIRSMDDSRQGIEKFLNRNPDMSIVALDGDNVVGALLCGHDGRRGCFYHVCVHINYRKHGVATKMVNMALEALKREGINKVSLIAFQKNQIGNKFWQDREFDFRDDLNYYDFTINEENIFTENKITQ